MLIANASLVPASLRSGPWVRSRRHPPAIPRPAIPRRNDVVQPRPLWRTAVHRRGRRRLSKAPAASWHHLCTWRRHQLRGALMRLMDQELWSQITINDIPLATQTATQALAPYLAANSHSNVLGLYPCKLTYIAADLRWPARQVAEAMAWLSKIDFIEFDHMGFIVWVVDCFRWNFPRDLRANTNGRQPPQVKMVAAQTRRVAHSVLYNRFMARYRCDYPSLLAACEPSSPEPTANPSRAFEDTIFGNESLRRKPCSGPVEDGTLPGIHCWIPVVGVKPADRTQFHLRQSGETWECPVYQSQVVGWADSYPGVDIPGELKRARQWCVDHPRRQKTPRGVNAFLGSWFSRAQNRSPGLIRHTTSKPAETSSGRRADDQELPF